MRIWCLVALIGSTYGATRDREYYEKEFFSWMHRFQVVISKADEFVHRLTVFSENDAFIAAHNENAHVHGYTLGHNEFSHLTWQEFKAKYFGFTMPSNWLATRTTPNATLFRSRVSLPENVDWVDKGAVTSVKNQGQCGSCWAFSSTGAVEGAAFVASGKLEDLSEQELVDCDTAQDRGCGGGLMDHAFKWIEHHGGLCREMDYPYQAKLGICQANDCQRVVEVSEYTDVPSNDEAALKQAVAQQPVSVAIEADQPQFQFYKSGVFSARCGTKLDHGVLVVGYGVSKDTGEKFWKVKNSWGAHWGEKGFIRLAREMGPIEGQCGVAMVPSFPTARVVSDGNTAKKASASIKTCADPHTSLVNFTSLSVSPSFPKRGHPVHFSGTGQIRKALAACSFDLQVKLAGEEVYSHTGSMCGSTHIPLPLHLGHINVHGFKCPLHHPGMTDSIDVEVNLPIIAPSGEYEIRVTASDQSDQLFCVQVKLELTNDGMTNISRVYEYLATS